jgi:uncharacterized protein YecE (DUF72 family)
MPASAEASCDLRIGTSGFDYPEWRGVLYPPTLPRAGFLAAYAERFPTLELNFSYYGMPRAEAMAALMDRAASTRLDYSIKANRKLTHDIDPASVGQLAKEFRAGIAPLVQGGRLAAILLGFPFGFAYRPDERRYLDRLLGEFAGLPLVVEFRHRDWFNARVLEGLRNRGVGLCTLDLPRLEDFPPVADLVTAEPVYIRFHGRNDQDWWSGDARGRYDYLYSREELASWVPRIEAMAATAKRLRIYFNNHARGQAAQNARELGELLVGAGLLPRSEGLSSEGLSSECLSSECLSSKGLSGEWLPGEGPAAKGPTPDGATTA